MSQSNVYSSFIQDLDFVDAQDETTVMGGLTIACLPIHGDDRGGCFPKPRPLPMPRPRPFPICELPYPFPGPKHPPIALDAMS